MESCNGRLLQLFDCIESSLNEVKRKMIASLASNDVRRSPHDARDKNLRVEVRDDRDDVASKVLGTFFVVKRRFMFEHRCNHEIESIVRQSHLHRSGQFDIYNESRAGREIAKGGIHGGFE